MSPNIFLYVLLYMADYAEEGALGQQLSLACSGCFYVPGAHQGKLLTQVLIDVRNS